MIWNTVNAIGMLKSVGELIVLIVVFLFVLALAYGTSKLTAKYQMKMMRNSNIEIIETQRLANNKLIQIVKVGDKVIAVGLGKDEVTYLTEVDPEVIIKEKEISSNTEPAAMKSQQNFQDTLHHFLKKKEK